MSPSPSRWRLLAAAVIAAGSVLLMHGLDVGTGGAHTEVGQDADHHEDDGQHCPGCEAGHLLVACVAVVGLGLAALGAVLVRYPSPRRRMARARFGVPLALRADRRGPPGWIALSVMRC